MAQATQLESITHNGETIRYLDTGTGDPAIVFVHGWTCNHTNWRQQVPQFSTNHRVVALDLPGHGSSDKPDRDYTIDNFVDVVAALIQELSLDRPIIVGHSMGGTIALNLARKHSGLTRGIVMVDAPIVPFPVEQSGLVTQLIAGLQSPAYQGIIDGFARMSFFNSRTDPALVDELAPLIASAPQRLMHTALTSIFDPEVMQSGPIPVPSFFIRAAEPTLTTEDELRSRYPGVDVLTLDCAHFIQMERPAETNAAIAKFVEQVQ